MKKKILLTLILASITTSALGSLNMVYASNKNNQLNEVVVNADKDKQKPRKDILPGGFVSTNTEVGFLGEKDTLDVPFSVTNFTEKTINTFGGPDLPQDSIFVNSPSVRQTGSILHGDFYFRGNRTNGTNYYVNGVPGVLTQFNTPTYIFDNIDIISGANVGLFGTGVQYETTSPGGVINAHTKVAPEQRVMDYTQTISGRGLFGEYLDYGERFGTNKEWGIRIMTETINGKTAVKGTKINGQSIYANIDHRSKHTKDNLFIGNRNLDIEGGLRWFELETGSNHLPPVPDGSNNYGYDGMLKATHGWLAVYNHEQNFNDHWDGFFNLGLQDNNLDKNVMPYGSRYYVDENGRITGQYGSGGTPQKYYYWQTGTIAHYATGKIKHDITISYNQAWRNRKTGTGYLRTHLTGSLEDGILSTTPDSNYRTIWSNKTRIKSFGIVDSMNIDKWNFILGIHKHDASSRSYNTATNTFKEAVKSHATSPTYGIVYKPNDSLSLYASHSEYFDTGAQVPVGYVNQYEVLDPIKSKQNELGIKYKKNQTLWTLAYYEIKKDENIAHGTKGKSDYLYLKDGETKTKGLELSVNGKLSDKWNIIGGLARMNATYEKTSGGKFDGRKVAGVSKWNGILGLQYNPNDSWHILGRAVYTGESPLVKSGINVPGYVVYDLGVSHDMKIGKVPTTLSLMCYNLFDKDYWMASRGSASNDWIYLSTPRTITFTAKLHF